MQEFKKLCEPAKIYLVVTVIFIVLSVFNGISALTLLVKAAFALIWTLVLNWLCSKGFSGLAWIIVLMPFIFFFLAMFMTMDMVGKEGFQTSDNPQGIGSCTKEGQTCPYNEFGSGTCSKNLECIPLPGSQPNNPYSSSSSSNPQGIVDICTQRDQPCAYNKFGSVGKCGKNLKCIPPPGSEPVNPYITVFGKPKPKPKPKPPKR